MIRYQTQARVPRSTTVHTQCPTTVHTLCGQSIINHSVTPHASLFAFATLLAGSCTLHAVERMEVSAVARCPADIPSALSAALVQLVQAPSLQQNSDRRAVLFKGGVAWLAGEGPSGLAMQNPSQWGCHLLRPAVGAAIIHSIIHSSIHPHY